MSTIIGDVERRSFQHDPYSTRLLDARCSASNSGSSAALDFFSAVSYMDENALNTSPKGFDVLDLFDHMTNTECEGGMSENGTDDMSRTLSVFSAQPQISAGLLPAPAAPTIRYASVDFRFGSAWFVAPFRTCVGEMVVVEYPHNGSLHLGLVSCISIKVPPTFAGFCTSDGTIRQEDIPQCPRLLRHAREFDKEAKVELRAHDLSSLKSAQDLATEMQAPITFLDAEWLLDLTAVTFLVNVWGDMARVDRLADELATLEGAEVVFTYPALC